MFHLYTLVVPTMAHQSIRASIAQLFFGTGSVFIERVLCLNIELSIVVAAAGAQFHCPFIAVFLSLYAVWLGSMEIGGVSTSCG
jgi:hypothetical protein